MFSLLQEYGHEDLVKLLRKFSKLLLYLKANFFIFQLVLDLAVTNIPICRLEKELTRQDSTLAQLMTSESKRRKRWTKSYIC